MIVKPYGVPFDVLQLKALERRLPRSHPKKGAVQQDLKRCIVGQQGEREVFYQLQFLPERQFYLFHNLRLIENNRVFQMDILVLHTNFIAIIEVKNFKGAISFNEIGQLVHVKEDKTEDIYPDPVSQAEKHRLQFQNWLSSKSFPVPPVETLVALGPWTRFSQTKIASTSSLQRIISGSNILSQILEFPRRFKRPIFKPNELNNLCAALSKFHIPLQRDLLANQGIQTGELIRGVLCPNCQTVMDRRFGAWVCSVCKYRGKKDHVEAFNDYYCLVGGSITTKEAGKFLNVSGDIAKYLLKKEGYKRVGSTKGAKYVLGLKNSDQGPASKN